MNLNNEDIEKYMLNRQMLPTSGPDFAEDDEDEEDDLPPGGGSEQPGSSKSAASGMKICFRTRRVRKFPCRFCVVSFMPVHLRRWFS